VALLNNPSCLLLDEPFSGLDPLGIEALKQLMFKLVKEHQMTLLISSHIIDVLSEICTTLSIINKGAIVKTGYSTEVLASCTSKYTLCGDSIIKADFLKAYQAVFKGNCATIRASAPEISQIIFKLSQQNIPITSCKPTLDLEQLFNSEPK
jgi:ABC-2 type transport system ATP-binding protein